MGTRVLIVDDDRDIREALGQTLTDEGFEVRTAVNGREALERLRQPWRPEVILLDLRMPVMDGWEFRRRQLAEPPLAGIPVVVLSAERNLVPMSNELRPAACLAKPPALGQLLDAVGNVAS